MSSASETSTGFGLGFCSPPAEFIVQDSVSATGLVLATEDNSPCRVVQGAWNRDELDLGPIDASICSRQCDSECTPGSMTAGVNHNLILANRTRPQGGGVRSRTFGPSQMNDAQLTQMFLRVPATFRSLCDIDGDGDFDDSLGAPTLVAVGAWVARSVETGDLSWVATLHAVGCGAAGDWVAPQFDVTIDPIIGNGNCMIGLSFSGVVAYRWRANVDPRPSGSGTFAGQFALTNVLGCNGASPIPPDVLPPVLPPPFPKSNAGDVLGRFF